MSRRPYDPLIPKDTWWDNLVCHPMWVLKLEIQIEALVLIVGLHLIRLLY